MRRPDVALALALLAACGEAPTGVPRPDGGIASVQPAEGTAAGGEEVTIRGERLPPDGPVEFGGVAASVQGGDETMLRVRTPPHVAGVVEVRVGSFALAAGFRYRPLPLRFFDASDALPECAVAGRGAAAVDWDGDGDLDLVQTVRGGAVRLLRNDGAAAFAAEPLAPDSVGDSLAIAAGDLDGDGRPDLVIGRYGADMAWERAAVLLGETSGGARDATAEWLPEGPTAVRGVALADFDGDGDLDLALASWNDAPGLYLYENSGAGFEDASGRVPAQGARTYGVAFADFDGDGDADLFAAVDGAPSRLFESDGMGGFVEAPGGALPDDVSAARTPALADFDRDGAIDVYLSAIGQDRLWLQVAGVLVDVTPDLLPPDARGTESAAAADLDLDGAPDLALARRNEAANTLYRNSDGTGRMYDYSGALVGGDADDIAFVAGDFDGNGAPDLFLSENGGRGRLMLGDSGRAGEAPPDAGAAPPDGGDGGGGGVPSDAATDGC